MSSTWSKYINSHPHLQPHLNNYNKPTMGATINTHVTGTKKIPWYTRKSSVTETAKSALLGINP